MAKSHKPDQAGLAFLEHVRRNLLRRGSQGEMVSYLNQRLHALGLVDKPGPLFDLATQRAVRTFQASQLDERGRPLTVDGLVGALTAWRLVHIEDPVPQAEPLPAVASTSTLPRGGSARGRLALQTAFKERDAGAREIGSNNNGEFVRKYLHPNGKPPLPWCAGFVSWCYSQHPQGCPYNYSLGARDILNQFTRRGWRIDPRQGQLPEPGDIVVWTRDAPGNPHAGHIGMVVELSEGGILYVIEGNKGPFPAPVKVFDYVYSRMNNLLGFGRVPD
ncbi:MAG: CHAP domain-containing protein [Pseudomonas sp.]